ADVATPATIDAVDTELLAQPGPTMATRAPETDSGYLQNNTTDDVDVEWSIIEIDGLPDDMLEEMDKAATPQSTIPDPQMESIGKAQDETGVTDNQQTAMTSEQTEPAEWESALAEQSDTVEA